MSDFLFALSKTKLTRGAVELEDSNEIYIVGEEEAIWLLRLILPYLNEFLLKLRGLFSGDPATTMKVNLSLSLSLLLPFSEKNTKI